MRFSFRKKTAPRWVDGLAWTPDRPLEYAPFGEIALARKSDREPLAGRDEIGWRGVWEPLADVPVSSQVAPEPVVAVVSPQILLPAPAPEPVSEPAFSIPEKNPAPSPILPEPANSNAPRNFLLPRLCLGLAQGIGLLLLTLARTHNVWPGSDPYLFAALALATIFAPLVLLEALGEISSAALSLWTATIAMILASLGLYHHWRIQGAEQAHAGLALALTVAVMLVVAQSLLRAGLKTRKVFPDYTALFDASWTLAARLAIWAAITGLAWLVAGSGESLFAWLTIHHRVLRPQFDAALLILPLVGVASALAFHPTRAPQFVRKALLAICTIALPMLVVIAGATLTLHVFTRPAALRWLVVLAAMLVLSLNASYRGTMQRGAWRKAGEFCAAFLIVALIGFAIVLLNQRVAALGWTAGRIQAAVMMALLGLYGIGYVAAALIGIGGGRWMQRIEGVNIVMALVMILTGLALSSPLADPVRLAVESQRSRLADGRADPAAFDFAWLRREGVRFGASALATMTQASSSEIARDAAIALASPAQAATPPPSQIGANIIVRTPGARLPNAMLAQDWTAQAREVPPCLTRPALACDAWFLDLDGDGVREILLVYGTDARWWASVLKLRDGQWMAAASLASPNCRGTLSALKSGQFALADPLPGWHDVLIAGLRLRAKPAPVTELPCPALTSTSAP